jgi:hypothetical protein
VTNKLLNAGEQFSSLPLHDAILHELRLNWQQGICIATISAFMQPEQHAINKQIIWYKVTETSLSHHSPWGESQYINAAHFKPPNIFILEMQSGDKIQISAERFEFE